MTYKLSIIIPLYNEERTILDILNKITQEFNLENEKIQIIIVNDGSDDNSASIFKKSKYYQHPNFHLINHSKNQGKGSAIRSAIPHVEGEYTIIQDADLEYDPSDISKLLKKIEGEELNVVYGSRNLNSNNQRGEFLFYWGGKLVGWCSNILYRQKLTDMPTCYKMFKTELLKQLPLKCNRFEFCPEVTALISRQGIIIKEIPIQYSPRNKQAGKKINWKDGVIAIWTLFKLRFNIQNYHLIAGLIFLFTFLLYSASFHMLFSGYEEETANVAKALMTGEFNIKRAGLGAVLLYTPFILLEKIFHFIPIAIVPVFYSALVPTLIFLISKIITKKEYIAIFISIMTAIGTVIWPYSAIGMEYQAMLLITLLLYFLLKWRKQPSNPIYVGLVFAYLCITKSYGCIIFIPMINFIWVTLKQLNLLYLFKQIRFLLKLILPATILFGLTLIINYIIHGTISGSYSLSHELQIWTWWEGFYGIFFSFGKSIFIFNPLLILSIVYWPKFYRHYRAPSLFILIAFSLLLLLTAPFSYWTDETWTVRKLVPILPLLHLPLIYFVVNKLGYLKKALLLLLIIVSIYIQILGVSLNLGKSLAITRDLNKDSLATLRYIPQLSHIVINHHLLQSYINKQLHGNSNKFSYDEQTWFRWTQKRQDLSLASGTIELSHYDKLDIYWFTNPTKASKIIFASLTLSSLLILVMISKIYIKDKRKNLFIS